MYLLVAGMSGFITSTKVKMIQSSDEFLLGGRKEALEGEDDELMPSYHSLPLSPFSLILLDSSTCLDPLVSFSDSLYVGSFLANHPPQWKSTDHEFFFFFFLDHCGTSLEATNAENATICHGKVHFFSMIPHV